MFLGVKFRTYGQGWKDLDEADYEKLRAHFPTLPPVKSEHDWNQHIADEEGMRAIVAFKLEVDLSPAAEDCMLIKLQDRMKQLELQTDDLAEATLKGGAVQIHIPDMVLMSINEVTWLDNCCTETVQEYLNDGWRILAICPPNAQRRPDYILGRVIKKERD
jgi:hypothetical protein